jgi:hypothetical protein
MPLPRYASKGAIRFLGRYVRRRFLSHLVVLVSVLAAVGCSVASQYAVKHLVDVLPTHQPPPPRLLQTKGGVYSRMYGRQRRVAAEPIA